MEPNQIRMQGEIHALLSRVNVLDLQLAEALGRMEALNLAFHALMFAGDVEKLELTNRLIANNAPKYLEGLNPAHPTGKAARAQLTSISGAINAEVARRKAKEGAPPA